MKKTRMDEDEINLTDILKILYKWRYFIIFFIIIVTLLSIFYYIFFIYKDLFVIYSSLKIGEFAPGQFQNSRKLEYLQSIEEIRYYVQSKELLEYIKKKISEKNLKKFLDRQNKEEKDEEDEKRKLLMLWKEQVEFKNAGKRLITRSPDRDLAIEINQLILDKIIENHNDILNKLNDQYISDYKEMINYFNKSGTPKIQLLISQPYYYPTEVLIQPDEDEKLSHTSKFSKIKIIIIIAFLSSLFISIFLSFILEFFKKLDWKEIKNVN